MPGASPPHPDLLQYCKSSREREILEAYIRHKTAAATAPAVGLANAENVTRHRTKVERRAREAGWDPVEPLEVDATVVSRNVKHVQKQLRKKVSTYIVTWAQNSTPIHEDFWAALLLYAEHTGGHIVVIPGRYKNPTSSWTVSQRNAEYWCDEVSPYLMNERIDLCNSLVVMGDIKTQPTAVNPLSGFETITGSQSGIFGHPKVQMKAVATPQNKLPKQLLTTGACTVHNYTDTKAGKKGEFHHILGACVVDIESDGTFHTRQVNADDDGSFIDLNYLYRPEGVYPAPRPEALVLGDVHTDSMDPVVEKVTFHDEDCMVDVLRPKRVVVHDWFDGFSGSHHHKYKPFLQFAKYHAGAHNVGQEVERTLEKTEAWLRPDIQFTIVDSNHNDHLTRWLEEGQPKTDHENAVFYHELYAKVLRGTALDDGRLVMPNPLQILARDRGIDNLHFLLPNEPFIVADIDLSNHGHLGSNGSRGSIEQYGKMGVKTISGHSHTPGIVNGAYAVGTNSILDMEYVKGPSSWMHTDCIVYANGKRSLVNIINGRWCARRRLKNSMVRK